MLHDELFKSVVVQCSLVLLCLLQQEVRIKDLLYHLAIYCTLVSVASKNRLHTSYSYRLIL